MQILKRLDWYGRLATLSVRVALDDAEMDIVRKCGLLNCTIARCDLSHGGFYRRSNNTKSAYRTQIGQVKGRWSPALIVTSGLVGIDIASRLVDRPKQSIVRVARRLLGRRINLARAISGITIRSSRVAEIKEAEFFILVSLASVARAIEYGREIGLSRRWTNSDLVDELDGLDFAGAGNSSDEGWPEQKRAGKNLLIISLVIVAAFAALQGLGRALESTFANVAANDERAQVRH